jgi:hypothetical protein
MLYTKRQFCTELMPVCNYLKSYIDFITRYIRQQTATNGTPPTKYRNPEPLTGNNISTDFVRDYG